VLAVAVLLVACGDGTSPAARTLFPVGHDDAAALAGTGSTFVEPLLRAWMERYKSVAPGVSFSYQATGSEAAIDGLKAGDGDFFASDVPLSEVDEATMGGSEEIMQLPWAAAAVALAYNLPGIDHLRLSADAVAGIFSGRIQRWDDRAIQSDNPDVRLPGQAIQVVYRSDGSGTTKVFTSYLQAAAGWDYGSDFAVRFPRGQAVRGSDGVVSAVKRSTGAIGYVGLAQARQAGLGVALLGNRAGKFVAPTPEAMNAALAGGWTRPFGSAINLLFTPESPGAYTLTTVTYLLFRKKFDDPAKASALRHFAAWALSAGQQLTEPLGYAPLPRQFRVPALAAAEQD
jgi:phosphate transport system substrate-binding protein